MTSRKAEASFLRFSISAARERKGGNSKSVCPPQLRDSQETTDGLTILSSLLSLLQLGSIRSFVVLAEKLTRKKRREKLINPRWLRTRLLSPSFFLCIHHRFQGSDYSHEEVALSPDNAVDGRARSRTNRADGEGRWNGFGDAGVALGDVLKARGCEKRV